MPNLSMSNPTRGGIHLSNPTPEGALAAASVLGPVLLQYADPKMLAAMPKEAWYVAGAFILGRMVLTGIREWKKK